MRNHEVIRLERPGLLSKMGNSKAHVKRVHLSLSLSHPLEWGKQMSKQTIKIINRLARLAEDGRKTTQCPLERKHCWEPSHDFVVIKDDEVEFHN